MTAMKETIKSGWTPGPISDPTPAEHWFPFDVDLKGCNTSILLVLSTVSDAKSIPRPALPEFFNHDEMIELIG